MATISRMPIANGYRHSNVGNEAPRLTGLQTPNLSPIPPSPMKSAYGHAGFAVSSRALGHALMTPTYGTGPSGGRQTVDDNWETYNQPPGHAHYAPSVSTALGEDRENPSPPYRP